MYNLLLQVPDDPWPSAGATLACTTIKLCQSALPAAPLPAGQGGVVAKRDFSMSSFMQYTAPKVHASKQVFQAQWAVLRCTAGHRIARFRDGSRPRNDCPTCKEVGYDIKNDPLGVLCCVGWFAVCAASLAYLIYWIVMRAK